jgi:hypothetical protein
VSKRYTQMTSFGGFKRVWTNGQLFGSQCPLCESSDLKYVLADGNWVYVCNACHAEIIVEPVKVKEGGGMNLLTRLTNLELEITEIKKELMRPERAYDHWTPDEIRQILASFNSFCNLHAQFNQRTPGAIRSKIHRILDQEVGEVRNVKTE